MAEFPAFPLWTDAYLGDTNHLTTIEHGAYLLLLFTAWRTPTYDLPDDDRMLAKFCRLTPGQWQRIKPAISPYWRVIDGRWSNGRLLDERDAVRRKVAQRSDAGKASALKRLNRTSTPVQRNANEIPTSKATATATTFPTEKDESNQFLDFYKIYPRKIGKRTAEKAYGAALKRADAEAIRAGAARYALEVEHSDQQFIAHPATWLNGDRWADEPAKFNNGAHNGRRKTTAHDTFIAAAYKVATGGAKGGD